MKISINPNKSIEENAEYYFERSKKAKKKLKGAEETLNSFKKKLEEYQKTKKESKEKQKQSKTPSSAKKEWYEKFHWFITSEDFLAIGGKDATSNDIIIRKHTEKDDYVFHTDIPGSPFFIIKQKEKTPTIKSFEETAQATASYSRAWKRGLSITEVYMIKGNQVKKELGLPKGTFMIHGKRTYFSPELRIAIGIKENKVMGGPISAVKKHCKNYVEVEIGNEKKSDTAKKIKHFLKADLDEIIRALPTGGTKIIKK